MNIYKTRYLNRDPFAPYDGGYYKDEYGEGVNKRSKHRLLKDKYSKYRFAKKMLELQNQMKYGKSADERGMARLKYAIGRRNSFEDCWALTQYWRGEYVGLFEPLLYYWPDDNYIKNYDDILYDYERTIGREKTEKIYQDEIKKAMSMLRSDEYIAEANYMLGYFGTVIRDYGNTAAAQHIKASCDNWQQWL